MRLCYADVGLEVYILMQLSKKCGFLTSIVILPHFFPLFVVSQLCTFVTPASRGNSQKNAIHSCRHRESQGVFIALKLTVAIEQNHKVFLLTTFINNLKKWCFGISLQSRMCPPK